MLYTMSDHYYSKQPQSKEKTFHITSSLKGETFTFQTGAGVFSKREVDFGSKLLIESFQMPELAGDVLDLGCGYGPIGISVAYFYRHRHVFLADVNERAIGLAKYNATMNNVENITILQSDGMAELKERTFAAVITNPPIRAGKQVIQRFYTESKKCLLPGGELWVVIQKKQGAPSTITFLKTLFEHVDIVNKKKGYYIIRAK